MHLLFTVNFTILSLHIFTSSASRSWIHSDEAEVDCSIRSIFIRFSIIVVHVSRHGIWLLLFSARIISTYDTGLAL